MIRHFVAAFVLCSAAAAQSSSGALEALRRTIVYRDAAISPDGARVAWVQRSAIAETAAIYWSPSAPGAKATAIELAGPGPREDATPVWSPDSQSLAFFSDAGSRSQKQLWIARADGSPARRITELKGYAERPRWSPDGKQIAFLYIEGGAGGGPLTAGQPLTGVIDTASHNQRIAIVDIASRAVRQVSPADLHVYDYDWSPDGKRFATTAAPGPGDNNWWVARIHLIDIASGRANEIYRPALQIAVPRWSPDGKRIAFIEGLMSDEGFHGGDVHTVAIEGGAARNHTAGRKSSPNSVMWVNSGRLLMTEWTGGASAISTLDLATGSIETLWRGDERVYWGGFRPNFAVTRDGRMSVVARHSFEKPPEIWAGPVGEWKQLTQNNASQKPYWGAAENVEWTNEGHHVQGWLLRPKQESSGARHPMVVWIHGGPSNVETPHWPDGFVFPESFAARGYYVFFPNPRGSYGQGEEFTRANVKDFGGGDLRDVLAGVDAVLARHSVDANRIGIFGWSYGGFMTMWAVTQTNRFKAGIAGAGIANWISYYGQNSIDQWMIPFFGASVYKDPAVYEKSSPIRFIRNVKTPTLVIVGERDSECPAPQSFEFWHALKTLGVPTELVVYPGEGHMFVKPRHVTDLQERMEAWFAKYLGAGQ